MAQSFKFKPLSEQTVVITGASSGIGLCTARKLADKGAKLVLAARNHDALTHLEREINRAGGHAIHVDADVGSEDDVLAIAQTAEKHFGGFDTWVNNAGVSLYGRLEDVITEDHRRLFETNFWGVVYGSLQALKHLKEHGGTIINVGSTLGDRAIPLQGMYCASKFAVKGFTDALRMEIEEAGYPVSVTLIKPAAIDTPYVKHAKNYLPHEPKNPYPVYAPDTVAAAILHAATHRERDIHVGAASKAFNLAEKIAPRITDRYMEAVLFGQQQTDKPSPRNRQDSLHWTSHNGGPQERGDYGQIGHVNETSLYTSASIHPWITTALLGAASVAGIAVAALLSTEGPTRRLRR